MAEINGGNFGDGLTTGAINEMLIGMLDRHGEELGLTTDQIRWMSALVGGAISESTGGSFGQGAGIADSATRNNFLEHYELEEYDNEQERLIALIEEAKANGDKEAEEALTLELFVVQDKYRKISARRDVLSGTNPPGYEGIELVPTEFASLNDGKYSAGAIESLGLINESLEQLNEAYALGKISVEALNAGREELQKTAEKIKYLDQTGTWTQIWDKATNELKEATIGDAVSFLIEAGVSKIGASVGLDLLLNPGVAEAATISPGERAIYAASVDPDVAKSLSYRVNYVYVLRNELGEVVYVGRTVDPSARRGAHLRTPGRDICF